MNFNQNFFVSTVCAAVYGTLCLFILIQARQRLNVLLAACCLVTAVWAGVGSVWPQIKFTGVLGALDIGRMLVWYVYLLCLYIRAEIASRTHIRVFSGAAVAAAISIFVVIVIEDQLHVYSLISLPIITRLCISIVTLLLVENLYFNLPEYARWHIAIPCVLLGGIACLDILVAADAILLHVPSTQLTTTRLVVLAVIAPLLVLAASRGERWSEPVRLSRAAVFHSATLVLSGSVLLALAIAGELLRRLDAELGWIAELSFVSLGVLAVFLFLSSRSARSIFQKMVVRHFFADRYDYRHQWLRCISTLSGTGSFERTELATRAVRAVADVVDSPNGSLFIFEPLTNVVSWAGSWNMPSGSSLPIDNQMVHDILFRSEITQFGRETSQAEEHDAIAQLGPVWLGIPLLHDVGVIGMVLVGPPRTPFALDQEVMDLLRIVGREVGTYIAEQRATESILETRDLHDYGQRFAFVAHDIKNVSSQLALLLANAELHLANPEFQRDMLQTVGASVEKIGALLKRLDHTPSISPRMIVQPLSALTELIATFSQAQRLRVSLQEDCEESIVLMTRDEFCTAVTHLVNNAIEADPLGPVELSMYHEPANVVIDVIDHGKGMSAEFIRDELFTPLRTTKVGGSGIGAYQARELIQSAKGQLLVISSKGIGTIMRIKLPRADECSQAVNGHLMLSTIGN